MNDTDDRIERFTRQMADLQVSVPRPARERWLERAGVVAMAVGVVLAIAGYVDSLGVKATPGSNVDVLNAQSAVILAMVGVVVALCGAVVFLRYSLARFLRFWLARQVIERTGD